MQRNWQHPKNTGGGRLGDAARSFACFEHGALFHRSAGEVFSAPPRCSPESRRPTSRSPVGGRNSDAQRSRHLVVNQVRQGQVSESLPGWLFLKDPMRRLAVCVCVSTPGQRVFHHHLSQAGGQRPTSKRWLTKLCLSVDAQSDQLCVPATNFCTSCPI